MPAIAIELGSYRPCLRHEALQYLPPGCAGHVQLGFLHLLSSAIGSSGNDLVLLGLSRVQLTRALAIAAATRALFSSSAMFARNVEPPPVQPFGSTETGQRRSRDAFPFRVFQSCGQQDSATPLQELQNLRTGTTTSNADSIPRRVVARKIPRHPQVIQPVHRSGNHFFAKKRRQLIALVPQDCYSRVFRATRVWLDKSRTILAPEQTTMIGVRASFRKVVETSGNLTR